MVLLLFEYPLVAVRLVAALPFFTALGVVECLLSVDGECQQQVKLLLSDTLNAASRALVT